MLRIKRLMYFSSTVNSVLLIFIIMFEKSIQSYLPFKPKTILAVMQNSNNNLLNILIKIY